MYLTYADYQRLGGTMPEEDFCLAEYKARSRIDFMTLGRVQNMQTVPEAVKMAMMVIMKVDERQSVDAQAASPIVASYSTDGYSESYGSLSEQAQTIQRQTNQQVTRMLFGVVDDYGVPLIYKGLS